MNKSTSKNCMSRQARLHYFSIDLTALAQFTALKSDPSNSEAALAEGAFLAEETAVDKIEEATVQSAADIAQ